MHAHIKKFKPDLLALSVTEDMWELGLEILNEIKNYKIKNKVPTIVGGVFATFAPEICVKEKLIDLVCVGEGENALLDLCDKIKNKEDYSNVTNCWVKVLDPKSGKEIIKKNPISKPVDINDNPIIDVSQFEENRLYRPMAKFTKCFQWKQLGDAPIPVDFVIHQTKSHFIIKRRRRIF